MSNTILEDDFVGTVYSDQRFLADPHISIVRYYDCINNMVEKWILELNKKEETQIEQKINSSKENNDLF